jgi:competence protein ComEC
MKYFFNNKLSEIPFFISLLTAAAIFLIAYFFDLSISLSSIISIIFIIIAIFFYLKKIYIITFISISFVFGILIYLNFKDYRLRNPYPISLEFKTYCIGEIISINSISPKRASFIFEGNIYSPTLPMMKNQRVLVKYYTDKFNFFAGDEIKFYGKIRLPKLKTLPNEFDEEIYYAGLNIQWIAYPKSITLLERKFNIYYTRDIIRRKFFKISQDLFSFGQSSIVNAIILGDKSSISPETKKIYAYSGTAHVLALSGLHVGLIAFVLYLFIGFLKNKHIKFILFVIALISYNFLVEFQPSAIRASAMAILITYAQYYQKQYNLLNVASFVVLISLMLEPYLLHSVSFQMSALAILGIAIFFEPFRSFFNLIIPVKSKLLEFIKNSLAVTFAASSILTPLVAYYFKTFSLISFIANLFVIPIFTIALFSSFNAIALYFIYFPIAEIYAELSTFLFLISNKINQALISIPYSFLAGDATLYFSIIFSTLTIYIFSSSSKKLLLSRLIFSVIMFLILHNSNYEKKDEIVRKVVYPRDQLVATICNYNDSTLFVYLADRKPAQYPKTDYYLVDYLSSLEKHLIIAVNGNAGINTANKLKKIRKFEYIELTPKVQQALEEKFFPHTYVSQIIEVIDEN